MFSIPLKISGVDEEGKPFEVTGRTITINLHGARIQGPVPLMTGQTIRVINQVSGAEDEFRVVGPVAPPRDLMGEWGVECLHVDKSIWGIYFPSSSEDADTHVLLGCRRCNSMSLQSLSFVEVEVLETAGLLTKPCKHCGETTTWGYPRRDLEVESGAGQEAERVATRTAHPLAADRRKGLRKAEQLAVRVRDYYGEMEIVQTETVSEKGFSFSSRRKYLVGQGIVVIFPFDAADEKPEVRARIVRVDAGPDPEQSLYAVRYEQMPH
jgi:hypothetical protein